MFRLPNPLKIFLLMIACLAPQKIWAEQVDTASITKILGAGGDTSGYEIIRIYADVAIKKASRSWRF